MMATKLSVNILWF